MAPKRMTVSVNDESAYSVRVMNEGLAFVKVMITCTPDPSEAIED